MGGHMGGPMGSAMDSPVGGPMGSAMGGSMGSTMGGAREAGRRRSLATAQQEEDGPGAQPARKPRTSHRPCRAAEAQHDDSNTGKPQHQEGLHEPRGRRVQE
eukprot:10440087-Lingulodinium_polyedra.AAC.1